MKRTGAALLLAGILAGCSGPTTMTTVASPTPTAATPNLCAIEFGVGADAMTVVYNSAESVDCADLLHSFNITPGGARVVALPSGPSVCEWHPTGEKIYGGAAATRSCALDAATSRTP